MGLPIHATIEPKLDIALMNDQLSAVRPQQENPAANNFPVDNQ
jgi:hypothetical protein